MRARHGGAVLGVLLLLCLAACRPEWHQADLVLRKADLPKLRRDAALLYKDNTVSSQPGYVAIRRGGWPASFEAFAPLRVTAYLDGVALALTPGTEPESGLYLVPEGMDVAPKDSARAHYHRLREGIYWYRFGGGKTP